MSLISAITGVAGVITGAGSIFSGGESNDAKRQATMDDWFSRALIEGPTSRYYQGLRCAAGFTDADAQRGAGLYWPTGDHVIKCGSPGQSTITYAQGKLAELQTRWAASGVLAQAGLAATGAAEKARPGSTGGALWSYIGESFGGASTLLLVGVAVVVIVLVVRSRRA